ELANRPILHQGPHSDAAVLVIATGTGRNPAGQSSVARCRHGAERVAHVAVASILVAREAVVEPHAHTGVRHTGADDHRSASEKTYQVIVARIAGAWYLPRSRSTSPRRAMPSIIGSRPVRRQR